MITRAPESTVQPSLGNLSSISLSTGASMVLLWEQNYVLRKTQKECDLHMDGELGCTESMFIQSCACVVEP